MFRLTVRIRSFPPLMLVLGVVLVTDAVETEFSLLCWPFRSAESAIREPIGVFLDDAKVRRQQPTDAQRCKSGHSSGRTCEHAHCCLLRGNAGQPLCCSVGTPSSCCVGRSPFCSAGAAPLRNADGRSTMLCCRSTRPVVAIATMVDPVADAGVADTFEARLADARKRHADSEYVTIPLLIVELGIRSQWATEHPSRPDSPRPVRNEGGVDDEVDGIARVSGSDGMKQRGVIKVDGGVDRSQAQVQQSTAAAGSSRADVDGRRRSPLRSGGGLSATTHVTAGGIALTYGYFKFSPDRITAGKDFQAVVAAVQANPMVVLLDSGCSHHLMGTKAVFVDMAPSDDMKHVRGLNGALQPVEGCRTFALQGEAKKRVLIPGVLYVPGVQANLISAGQLKESGVQLQGDGDEMLLAAATRESSTRADPPCVSCIGGKLALHTFPDKGSDAEEALDIVHIDLCGPFWVAAKDGRLASSTTLTCSYTPQQNGMAEGEMRTAVETVRTMLLHMGVQHHWWHLALRQLLGAVDDAARDDSVPAADRKKPDLMLARVWGCMVQFMTVPLLTEVDELADEDVVEVPPPPHVFAPPFPIADRPALTSVSTTGDKRSLEASPVALASGIAGGRQGAKLINQDGKLAMTREQQTGEPVKQEAAARVQSTGQQQTGQSTRELSKSAGGEQLVDGSKQLVDDLAVDEEGELSAREDSTDSDVVEVPITKPELRRTSRARRPPERLSFHACLPLAAFTTVYDKVDDDLLYDDAEEDKEPPELDPDVHADPEHRWDIATMTVKEAMASWKGEVVKAAMEEEIRSLIGMGTWELVERSRGVNIMKNRWVLTTKYCIDDTVERKKARLVVKGFMQVCGADYDETYSPVSSYVFLSIVAVLDLNLMQLDMKNAFLQRKLDMVLYNHRCCSTGHSTCWVLVYVDDLLAASSSPAMLKELKELMEAAFELRDILPVVKYLGLEIVRDRPARKLWLHQQGYADKLRRRFIDEEQGDRVPKTPVSVDAYAELTFNDEEAHEREEEECRQKVGSSQFAATTMRLDIAFACSKLGSGLTFGGGPVSLKLIGYVDVDDAGDNHNWMSTGGYVFVFGGAAVSWSSQRIKCATLSSTESEYVAATDAGKEGRRLRFLLANFKLLDAGKPTVLRVDNKSAITGAEGLGLTGNLKHMERRYAWLQHMVRRGKFVLKYIPTTKQPADFRTKALHFPAFNRCSVAIGQVHLADVGDGDDDVQQ
ncbi:unnamed protein product [Closterium sp. NIES-54]